MTPLLIQRPRRRVASESSETSKNQLAPLARKLPKPRPLLRPSGSFVRWFAAKSFWNFPRIFLSRHGPKAFTWQQKPKRKVDQGQELRLVQPGCLMSCCLATVNLVFGSPTSKSAKSEVPPTSPGNLKLDRFADRTSPIVAIPPQDKAITRALIAPTP